LIKERREDEVEEQRLEMNERRSSIMSSKDKESSVLVVKSKKKKERPLGQEKTKFVPKKPSQRRAKMRGVKGRGGEKCQDMI